LTAQILKKIGKRTTRKKSKNWSFKLNAPGGRFMVLCDRSQKVRAVWGGFSCKVYDSDFLDLKSEWIQKYLKGGHILADNHFRSRGIKFKDPKFYCNTRSKKDENNSEDESSESDIDNIEVDEGNNNGGGIVTGKKKEEKAYNKAHRHCRSRIEGIFGNQNDIYSIR